MNRVSNQEGTPFLKRLSIKRGDPIPLPARPHTIALVDGRMSVVTGFNQEPTRHCAPAFVRVPRGSAALALDDALVWCTA